MRLRKDINAQKRTAYEKVRLMKLSMKYSLEDLIWERRLFFNTCWPNFKGALALYSG